MDDACYHFLVSLHFIAYLQMDIYSPVVGSAALKQSKCVTRLFINASCTPTEATDVCCTVDAGAIFVVSPATYLRSTYLYADMYNAFI